jgi:hypothetical protein
VKECSGSHRPALVPVPDLVQARCSERNLHLLAREVDEPRRF